MKKFLITFFILAVLGGTAFFFGWVQYSVPPGKYGVISSKTHGIDPDYVRSGEFRWIWYKLLPTNVKIAVFNIEHTRYPVNYSSDLPSGSTYANFVGVTNVDFSWNLRGEIAFSIDPQKLVGLTRQFSLENQEDLDSYILTVAHEIEMTIIRSLSAAAQDSARLEKILLGNTDTQMMQEIIYRFPQIHDFSFSMHTAIIPDFVLYDQLRHLYEDFLSNQREAVSSSFGRRAETHIENQLRFEELERYGDLLTRFPVLLDYLLLESDLGKNQ